MLKKSITYVDFNGDTVTEDFYFHLSKAELVELQLSHEGGLEESIRRLAATQDGKAIIAEFKGIILGAYGQRSLDGKRFIKSQTLRDEFESTEAYSTLFMELVTDANKAAEFVRGIVPQDLAEEAAKVLQKNSSSTEEPKKVVTREELMAMTADEIAEITPKISSGEVTLEGTSS